MAEDNAGNYESALRLYKSSLEYFSTHLKYEKNPSAKKAITAKVRRRAARGERRRRRRATGARADEAECRPDGRLAARAQFTEYLARAEELQRYGVFARRGARRAGG